MARRRSPASLNAAPPMHATHTSQTPTTPATDRSYTLPPLGNNPSTEKQGTTPGSFAKKGCVGTPWTFSSPDTPGMPQPSEKTAWDFMPEDWEVETLDSASGNGAYASS